MRVRKTRRDLATVFAVGAFLLVGLVFALSGDARADGELQPTQVVAEIPDGYDELFQLEWGGGSLYQLKGRLATMGCLVNNVWVYDGAWRPYNQYNVPLSLVEDFLAEYEQDVPAGTLWADCFDHCDYRHDEYEGENCTNTWEGVVAWAQENRGLSTSRSWTCVDDFGHFETTGVAEGEFGTTAERWVRPVLPMMPSVCGIVGLNPEGGSDVPFFYNGAFYNINRDGIPVADSREPFVYLVHALPQPGFQNLLLPTLLHELCHSAQEWHVAQQLRTDSRWPERSTGAAWVVWSPAGRSFTQVVGFRWDDERGWITPEGYRNIYGGNYGGDPPRGNPTELAAELCSFYLLRRIPEEDRSDEPYPDILPYLTLEIVAWLEEWMILPQIETADDAAGGVSD